MSLMGEEVLSFVTDEIRQVGVHLLGRRLYETMLYWETADLDHADGGAGQRPIGLRRPGGGNRAVASRAAGDGDIAVGGATLAAEAAASDLIDEYRARVYPVLVGGGIPYFAQGESRVDLQLVETRTVSCRVVHLRYRVAR